MDFEQQLRDALHVDAAELTPVGPGPDDSRRRAFRRKRRMQSGVVAMGAVVLAGGSLAVIETRPSGHRPQVRTSPVASRPTPDLAWRTVDGTVLTAFSHFTTADGVTYALSTAPAGQPGNGNSVANTLYATHDGITWTNTPLGTDARGDVAESKGVLYAVSTGTASNGGSTDYTLATSSNGGAKWDDTPVPVELKTPAANVPLTVATRSQVARGEHTTVVMVEASYYADVSKALNLTDAEFANPTPEGVQVMGQATCRSTGTMTKVTIAPDSGTNPATKCEPQVLATHAWSEFGVTDPAALHQQQAIVHDDGGSWQRVDVPIANGATVEDVTATSSGFLMAEQNWSGSNGPSSSLLSSSDGRTWSQLTNPLPSATSVAIAGDRVVLTDDRGGQMAVSNDGGGTWSPTTSFASLVPDAATNAVGSSAADAGPLGYAVTVMTGIGTADQKTYLLDSADGVTWKTTDLADVGAPSRAYVARLTVGADHLDVSFAVPNAATPNQDKLVTLVGTPKA